MTTTKCPLHNRTLRDGYCPACSHESLTAPRGTILRAKTVRAIRAMWTVAHAEGRAVLTADEVLVKRSAYGISSDDFAVAVSRDIVRKGLSGYWLKEAPDAGAVLVMRAAMKEPRTRHCSDCGTLFSSTTCPVCHVSLDSL